MILWIRDSDEVLRLDAERALAWRFNRSAQHLEAHVVQVCAYYPTFTVTLYVNEGVADMLQHRLGDAQKNPEVVRIDARLIVLQPMRFAE